MRFRTILLCGSPLLKIRQGFVVSERLDVPRRLFCPRNRRADTCLAVCQIRILARRNLLNHSAVDGQLRAVSHRMHSQGIVEMLTIGLHANQIRYTAVTRTDYGASFESSSCGTHGSAAKPFDTEGKSFVWNAVNMKKSGFHRELHQHCEPGQLGSQIWPLIRSGCR